MFILRFLTKVPAKQTLKGLCCVNDQTKFNETRFVL